MASCGGSCRTGYLSIEVFFLPFSRGKCVSLPPQLFLFFFFWQIDFPMSMRASKVRERERDNESNKQKKKNCYQLENFALVVCEIFIMVCCGWRMRFGIFFLRVRDTTMFDPIFQNACVGVDDERQWCELFFASFFLARSEKKSLEERGKALGI